MPQKDSKGLTICPNCFEHYVPVLREIPQGDRRCIQDIFPKATPEQREQLVTGICRTKCWNEFLGVR
jgi:hypothetical protein